MGNCASSKYAVDEDKAPKKPKLTKKQRKELELEANGAEVAVEGAEAEPKAEAEGAEAKAEEERIDFIDEQANQGVKVESTEHAETKTDENQKKEVTTYQTTVVKHSQKEGDELLEHLRSEAFRTLQSLLRKQENLSGETSTSTVTTTSVAANGALPQSVDSDSEDIVAQIKAQAVCSIGEAHRDKIGAIVDFGAEQIRGGGVSSMGELSAALEEEFGEEKELVAKVVNSTTGFLTAKGTEAGSLLSNILANVAGGLQGVMSETEKTTVKVTRTVTEHVMSGGEMREVTRVIAGPAAPSGAGAPPCSNIEEVLRNLQNGLSVDGSTVLVGAPEITRTTVTSSGSSEEATRHSEQHESVRHSQVDAAARHRAERVVEEAVSAAVEQVSSVASASASGRSEEVREERETHVSEESVRVEEESSVRTSSTRLVLDAGGAESVREQVERAQREFYRQGKEAAEQAVGRLVVEASEEQVGSSGGGHAAVVA